MAIALNSRERDSLAIGCVRPVVGFASTSMKTASGAAVA